MNITSTDVYENNIKYKLKKKKMKKIFILSLII